MVIWADINNFQSHIELATDTDGMDGDLEVWRVARKEIYGPIHDFIHGFKTAGK